MDLQPIRTDYGCVDIPRDLANQMTLDYAHGETKRSLAKRHDLTYSKVCRTVQQTLKSIRADRHESPEIIGAKIMARYHGCWPDQYDPTLLESTTTVKWRGLRDQNQLDYHS